MHPFRKVDGHFNPRSREGSDKGTRCTTWTTEGFQSSLPRGERLLLREVVHTFHEFQSSLPRGERLVALVNHGQNRLISILAPARGATMDGLGQKG